MHIDIHHNLNITLERIQEAERRFERPPGSVSLLAVSKAQPLSLITKLVATGQMAFGENYLQEALPKISAATCKNIEWHYIGAVQSRKAADVAQHFSWVHTVSRLVEAQKLSQYRHSSHLPLQICLQVKLDNSPTKSGVLPHDVLTLAKAVHALPHLTLRGLMTLPPYLDSFSEQRQYFSRLRALFTQLQQEGLPLDTLSMGMTHDFEAAIAEGSTLVRIGTGIFGQRG